jgi:CheY-like chemotaxis protein
MMAKILVVDDSRLSRRFLTGPLRQAGHEVIEADNGEVGLELYREHQPECVFTDLLMPVMDGPTLLARLREISDVPVIVVTADIQQTSRDKCEAHHISAFLNKPFKADDALAALDEALAATRA